jgi:DNA-binding Lrp family transcriptional regulator
MNNKRKVELGESLSSALEPPRKRQVARLDSILKDYIDPRDIAASSRETELKKEETTIAQDTRVALQTTQIHQTTLAHQAIEEQKTTVAHQTSLESSATLAPEVTLAYDTTQVPYPTVASHQGEPKHHARVDFNATQVLQTTVAQYTIVETEYTKTPNDLWDEIMPTLDPYDQSVLWQLYRLTRGYHRATCTIGFPRLATRCNISPKQAQISIGRLEKRGLIKRTGSDFGNRNVAERGNIYEIFLPEGREVQRTRVSRNSRVEQPATVAPDTSMKLNTQKENIQTQDSVSMSSRFSLEECRQYAGHLKQTGQGITNPGGYATKIFRSGEADAFIEAFLKPSPQIDVSQCLDCRGSGFIYIDPPNPDKGVRPCKHDNIKSNT